MNQPQKSFTKGERVYEMKSGRQGRVDFLYRLDGVEMVMVEWEDGSLTAKPPDELERSQPEANP